ncbi:hypothetical protein HRG_007831 [Hirsutella rhossiliensis]|uniref:Uncharacterized protein n=1 Tax=Hirsutella rhossiliensis TaxID=111463 RepID=A0A9P8SF98_9HYPO|nr:uncharacterized protein HRG_07831 [Hirsutella rhossiliensis]KAH0960678.1 hypothetical protein HRG_07831 [Hirsutella rhossiliensis]
MQSQSQARDPNQLPDDGHALTTTLTKSEHDTYYSNRDIAILHAIVAAAQHQLDHAPHPKPLPAAALFKAYDDILPDFGIDPDSDYHLSAFVFRVGGEQGHGTLSDVTLFSLAGSVTL